MNKGVSQKHLDNFFKRLETRLESLPAHNLSTPSGLSGDQLCDIFEYILKKEDELRTILPLNNVRLDTQGTKSRVDIPLNIVKSPKGDFLLLASSGEEASDRSSKSVSRDTAWAIDSEMHHPYNAITIRHPKIGRMVKLAKSHAIDANFMMAGQPFKRDSEAESYNQSQIRLCDTSWEQIFYYPTAKPKPALERTELWTAKAASPTTHAAALTIIFRRETATPPPIQKKTAGKGLAKKSILLESSHVDQETSVNEPPKKKQRR